jgi:hypothetical protein
MLHRILIGALIYFGGAAITAGLMMFGSWRSGERPGEGYDLKFMSCGVALWFITLPVVLSLMVGMRGPREVDVEEEGIDL